MLLIISRLTLCNHHEHLIFTHIIALSLVRKIGSGTLVKGALNGGGNLSVEVFLCLPERFKLSILFRGDSLGLSQFRFKIIQS